ncbi:MAG: acyl-CoA carboxylase subunit beta, partial [Marinilabiliaceae bacterium]|nr:acyl-CoA carboxylase subunit beta [Marinilabiliaceae bacterium]
MTKMKDNRKPYKRFSQREKERLVQYDEAHKDKQHNKGKLSVYERIDLLLDKGSFREIDAFVKSSQSDSSKAQYGDGVVCGHGEIHGRKVLVYAQDATYMGGSLGHLHAKKIQKTQALALKMGHPIIGLIDSGGARIQEGVASLAGYGGIFYNNVKSSGIIPQISVVLGPAAGGAVYSPALTDFIVMVKRTACMFVTGPEVVKEVLNQQTTFEELGGADVHASKSGVADLVYEDEEHALMEVRKLLTYLPANNVEQPPLVKRTPQSPIKSARLPFILPDDSNRPYDVLEVINLIMDAGTFFEIGENYAANIVIGLGRLNNQVIGIVANQPKEMAGTLDINSSRKAARFVRFCDNYNIPLLVFEDVPGFMPGIEQEHDGVIMHGAKLLYAFAEATVPKITVILRKAYGGAYIVMNSKSMGGDFNFAWPTAEIAVMGPEGAVNILHRKELLKVDNPVELKAQLTAKYREEIANPHFAEEHGYIDEVIAPESTREVL